MSESEQDSFVKIERDRSHEAALSGVTHHGRTLSTVQRRKWAAAAAVIAALGIAGGWYGVLRRRASEASLADRVQAMSGAYPLGRWRLARKDLDGAVFWISHIVIMHRESASPGVLEPMMWGKDVLPDRSVAEAADLAARIAAQLVEEPATFAQLADKYSDDRATQGRGGSLGGIQVGNLPDEYIDALAVLPEGVPSKVIRTPVGFHILVRHPVPHGEVVAGRRLLIAYEGIVGGAKPGVSKRTRSEAMVIALQMAEQARHGASFDELLHHSDSPDRERGGRVGTWATTAPGERGREIEVLSALKVGEVSKPVDTILGLQILQRLEPTEQPKYAMAAIRLAIDQTDPKRADEKARELIETVRRDPLQIPSLQKTFCCDDHPAEKWEEGHGYPPFATALDAVPIGDVVSEPIHVDDFLYVLRRLDPNTVPEPPPPKYELPSPRQLDIESIFKGNEGERLAVYVGALAKTLRNSSSDARWSEAEHIAVAEAFDVLAERLRHAPDGTASWDAYEEAVARVRYNLSPQAYGALMQAVDEWATEVVLHGGMMAAAAPTH